MFEWVYWVESIELLKIFDIGGDLCLEIALWFVVLHDYNNIGGNNVGIASWIKFNDK